MNETRKTFGSLADEAPRRYVLNEPLFRSKTRALGARTDAERCRVAGISRASLNRWRRGAVAPSLPVLDRMAMRLGVNRDRLVREVKP